MPAGSPAPFDPRTYGPSGFDFSFRLCKREGPWLRLCLQSADELQSFVQIPCSITGPGRSLAALAGATVFHIESFPLRHSARHPALAPRGPGCEKALHTHSDCRPAPVAVLLRFHVETNGRHSYTYHFVVLDSIVSGQGLVGFCTLFSPGCPFPPGPISSLPAPPLPDPGFRCTLTVLRFTAILLSPICVDLRPISVRSEDPYVSPPHPASGSGLRALQPVLR